MINDTLQAMSDELPAIPAEPTAEERKNGTLNMLMGVQELLDDMMGAIYTDAVPVHDAAGFFLVGAVSLTNLAGLSIDEVGEYALDMLRRSKSAENN